ncbi:MAG: rhomboid family intramembrane serine protease [Planctomycetota bacterium]
MGIFNRDYMRGDSQFRLSSPASWNAIHMIVIVSLTVWLCSLFGRGESDLGLLLNHHFKASWLALSEGRIWTLFTSVVYHEGLFHILLNLFVLWMFGRTIEEEWGKWRFLRFFLIGGVLGALAHCVYMGATGAGHTVHGASAGVFGVVLYFICQDPRREVLLFGVLPMQTWMMGAILVGVDVLGLFGIAVMGGNVAHVAHLAGAGFGAAYFALERRGMLPKMNSGGRRSRSRRRPAAPRKQWMVPPDGVNPYTGRSAAEEQRLDHLLRKVGHGGLDALTPEEREFLMDMSKKAPKT